MNYPDARKHYIISLIKSLLRIIGFVMLLISPIISVGLLVLAEFMGIIEEDV